MKDFDNWNIKKKKIDNLKKFNHCNEMEIWWISLGQNIGTEIFGKGKDFSRPALIINSENSESVICLPLSSKIKKGKYRCIIKTDDSKLHDVLISQIRLADKRRLIKKIYTLDIEQYKKINDIYNKLFRFPSYKT